LIIIDSVLLPTPATPHEAPRHVHCTSARAPDTFACALHTTASLWPRPPLLAVPLLAVREERWTGQTLNISSLLADPDRRPSAGPAPASWEHGAREQTRDPFTPAQAGLLRVLDSDAALLDGVWVAARHNRRQRVLVLLGHLCAGDCGLHRRGALADTLAQLAKPAALLLLPSGLVHVLLVVVDGLLHIVEAEVLQVV
jgi:hypothetical protein